VAKSAGFEGACNADEDGMSSTTPTSSVVPGTAEDARQPLRKSLGLADLIPMQVLLVVGITWAGIAARQGGTHVAFWLLGVVLLFLPVAAVISFSVKIWPFEGGVYQWTKHTLGPFAGFISAWNFGAWALLAVASLGLQTSASLAYALGPRAAWMANSHAFINGLNIGLFTLIVLVNFRGFRVGRWIAHFGTGVAILVIALLAVLLLFHPHTDSAHPHLSPQQPFSLAFPVVTLMSLNLFSKLTFNGLTGLEQVAVFAGETRDAARTILRSAWIAAPGIALMYIVMTGSMLTYTPADKIDLTAPVPQALAAAFADGAANADSTDWGQLLSRAAILALAVATIAQFAVIVAETSRLPMVAAWDHLIPAWFTRLHPRFRTPTRSLAVIGLLSVSFSCLASAGIAAQEAFQLIVTSGNICYGINYLLMFAVPLAAGTRFGLRPDLRPSAMLRLACVCGIGVTLLSMLFNLVPIVDVATPWIFALKVVLVALAVNTVGSAIYWRGARRKARREGPAD
jgi:amino acid transporter